MNDDKLLSLLAESLAEDTPPPDAMDTAYASFGWRTLEADLAQLIDDSQVEVVGFREAAYSRLVSYETAHGTIEVAIDDQRFQVSVSPPPRAIVLRQPAERRPLTVDDTGRASQSDVSGPIRFEVTWPDGSAVTPWLTL